MSYTKSLAHVAAFGFSAGLLLGLLILSSCQVPPEAGANFGHDRLSLVSATRFSGRYSAFEIPGENDAATSREDLLRLADALDQGYEALDFMPPFPKIWIADPNSPLLPGHVIGLASMDKDGEAVIYFDRRDLSRRRRLKPLVLHELAHLKAWRQHGHRIAAHGPEFQRICQSVATRRQCAEQEL